MTSSIEDAGGKVVDASEANALVITWHPNMYEEIEARLHPGVEWVQLGFAGIDGIFTRQLFDEARAWTGAQGAYAQPVAEHILTGVLAMLRELPRLAREQTWTGEVGRLLGDVTVGIVGGGGIGACAAGMLHRLGADTVAVSRSGHAVEGTRWSGDGTMLPRLLTESDIVVLAVPLTSETHGMIGAGELESMKPGACLINVARGSVVDTEALVASLRSGQLAGAFLDVTDPEPLPDGHPLWQFENVIVTPHTACSTEMSRQLMYRRVADNVRRFMGDEPLLGRIDGTRGY